MAYSMASVMWTFEPRESEDIVKLVTLVAAAMAVAVSAIPADARPRDREQDAAFQATREGRVMPLRAIESRILPQMEGARYLGPEFDEGSGRYRLKFMRGGSVIWLDIDGRTGRIVGRSGG
jgi:cation diffusion facilitator CzcD-associated flavoprotein CzcO